MSEPAKPTGSLRARVGKVKVAWVESVPAPLWSRYGPADEDTEDMVLAWAEQAGALKVKACWAGGMFRVERA